MNNTVTRQVLGKVAITSRGEYDTSKSYEILDVVTYQGSSYLSKKYNNDSLPTNANDWQLLAQKGDTYELSEEDLQRIAEQITSNANSAFNQNVKEKTDGFNSNATEKLGTYNSNHTAKLKEYNDNATSKLSAYNTNTVTKTNEYNSNHTDKLSAYDTNASNKVDAYNTNADARLEEYNTNANNKIAEYDEHSKELNNKIVSTRNELERLKSNVLNTGEDTDTFIHLEDSAMAEMQEIKVDGVCKQNTTTGKNKIETLAKISNIDGLTITRQENGTLLINGSNAEFAVSDAVKNQALEAGTYTLSVKLNNTEIKANVYYHIGDNQNQIYKYKDNKPLTLTFDTNFTLARIQPYFNAITYNNAILSIQLEEGSNATEYEPFTNGASPNPDYPQEIKTITDSLKVTSCGKNLFDIDKFKKLVTGQGLTSVIDGTSIICNGTATETYATILVPLAKNIKFYPGQYTMSIANSLPYNIAIQTERLNGSRGNDLALHSGKTSEIINITEILSVASLFLSFQTDRPTLTNFTISNIQIERSNTASEYENYIESQIQAKLPEGEFIGYINATNYDALSTIYNSNAGAYQLVLNKCIAKITIDGTKGSFSMPSVGRFNIDNIISNYLKTSQSYGITTKCDNYISFPQTLSNSDFDKLTSGYNYGIGLDGGTANNIRIKNVNFSNVEDFKNDLKQHPITLYYILNIESRRTLYLGVIDMPMSYKDITNIFTDSNLLPTINAKYYRVFDKTIQNAQINNKTLKQEITDLNATVSALDNRLKALETKTVEEPTESEGTV